MPYTVWGAFDKFRKDCVDLDSDDTKTARASRNYLLEQLKLIARSDDSFPVLSGRQIPFGSFARNTKIQPLDDIDLLIPLVGKGMTSVQSSVNQHTYWLRIDDDSVPLAAFRDDYGYINSTKVLNKFKSSLSKLPVYERAGIKRTMQAVTLKLISYSWVYDIVPAVPVNDGRDGTEYYLIPNGHGDWIRTDPRVDDSSTTEVNVQHGGNFLPLMRLLKFWNSRTHKPRLSSYYFETLAIKVFRNTSRIQEYPSAIKFFFDQCPIYLSISCPDPKGLGPALDAEVESTVKKNMLDALSEAATHSGYALMYERLDEDKDAIYWWGRVFGSKFPSYG